MIESIFKGFYPYFAIFAAAGIFLRIRKKEWTSAETVVLSLVIGHGLLTVFQIGCFGTEWNLSRRYLLPAAPFLFGWAGYMLLKILQYKFVWYLLPFSILFLTADAVRPSLEHNWKKTKKHQSHVINTFAPIIRKNWHGETHYTPELWWDEYRSPKRPIIQCDSPALGYCSGGRFWNADSTEKLYPDYILQDNFLIPQGAREIIHATEIDSVNYILWKRKYE